MVHRWVVGEGELGGAGAGTRKGIEYSLKRGKEVNRVGDEGDVAMADNGGEKKNRTS